MTSICAYGYGGCGSTGYEGATMRAARPAYNRPLAKLPLNLGWS